MSEEQEKYYPGDRIRDIHVGFSDFNSYVEIVPHEHIASSEGLIRKVATWKDGKWQYVEYPDYGVPPADFKPVRFRLKEAERLRDKLIELLGNPKKTATESELKATKAHLNDMRMLVFKDKMEGKPCQID